MGVGLRSWMRVTSSAPGSTRIAYGKASTCPPIGNMLFAIVALLGSTHALQGTPQPRFPSGIGIPSGIGAWNNAAGREQPNRAYASVDGFARIARGEKPIADDLKPPPSKEEYTRWLSAPYRIAVILAATASYPLVTLLLCPIADTMKDVAPAAGPFVQVTGAFIPALSILFATLYGLTMNLQYNRLQKIQEAAAVESADIVLLTRMLLSPSGALDGEENTARRARVAAALAEQVSTLVGRSRQDEMMQVMRGDPYGEIAQALDEVLSAAGATAVPVVQSTVVVSRASSLVERLISTRAARLSSEALDLPPTHYSILSILGAWLLVGFALTGAAQGVEPPPIESSILFGILTSTFVLSLNFALDLNRPFEGVYQIRRSASSSSLLAARMLLSEHLPEGGLPFEQRLSAGLYGPQETAALAKPLALDSDAREEQWSEL